MSAAVVRVRNLMLRATRVLGDAMANDRRAADHAFRVLNSRHLWSTATAANDAGASTEAAS